MLQRAPREIRKALKYVEQPGLSVEFVTTYISNQRPRRT